MLWVETGLKEPSEELKNKAFLCNAKLLHVPSLVVKPLVSDVDISNCDGAFVASPRAAKLGLLKLSSFQKKIIAVGSSTAKELEKVGITAETYVDGLEGAWATLENISKNGTLPFKKLAWLSAKETAVNLKELSEQFQIEIVHVPLYETILSENFQTEIQKYPEEKLWIVRCGKSARYVASFLGNKDVVVALGKSAQSVFQSLNISVRKTLDFSRT